MKNKIRSGEILLPLSLFIFTFITTTFAGVEWTTSFRAPFTIWELTYGLSYSLCLIAILASHEFGHYFASLYHKVKATLPYFIPIPPIAGMLNFGTMGAVIRTKTPIKDSKALLDIGAAGPIAGFVVCLGILLYGFTHLPPEGVEYIRHIHPFNEGVSNPNSLELKFGDSLLFMFLREIFKSTTIFIPPMTEIYHYPFLCTGWFGLFITSMNLIPVGQLDGGHIAYAVLGWKKHKAVASISFILIFAFGVLGAISLITNTNLPFGWAGWLFWSIMLFFIIKVEHPPIEQEVKLGIGRRITGYLSFFIFIISFSPTPFMIF